MTDDYHPGVQDCKTAYSILGGITALERLHFIRKGHTQYQQYHTFKAH